MENSWDRLEPYRGTDFSGDWPTIPEMFHLSARLYPERNCFTTFTPEELRFTYREVEEHVNRIAAYLLAAGLKKGDRVALTGKNTPYWGMAYLAISEAGGVIVPLDYHLENAAIEHLIDHVEASIAFVDKEKFDELKPSKTRIETKISLSPEKENFVLDVKASDVKASDVNASDVNASDVNASDVKASGSGQKKTHKAGTEEELEEETKHQAGTEDELAAILFTSGTTGNEKGVMLTHRNFISDAFQASHKMFLDVSYKDIWYALLPLHHSYCMTAVFLEGIVQGSEIVFAPRLAVPQIMKDLERGGITMFMGIPLLFNKILQGIMNQIREKGLAVYGLIRGMMYVSSFIKRVFGVNPGKKMFGFLLRKANLDTVRILICGGGPLAPQTFRLYNQLGLNFTQGYGLTETAPILTLNPTHRFKVKSVGKVFPLVEMEIMEPDEQGIGEIIVKGPNVGQGYYHNEQATKELFTEEGFLKTGDEGYLDSDNYLYLTGRKKSIIVTEGGKNVFPEEIEDHFQLCQAIEQIMVRSFIADSTRKIEGIEAVVLPNKEYFSSRSIYDTEEIIHELSKIIHGVNKDLRHYKRISRMRLISEAMEMTTTKKIKRPAVEEIIKASNPGTIALID